MGLAFVIESLRFYRLPSKKTARGLFLLAFLLSFIIAVLPWGDKDLSSLANRLLIIQQSGGEGVVSSYLLASVHAQSALSVGNLIYIGLVLINRLLLGLIALAYSTAMLLSFDDYPVKEGLRSYIRKLPHILLIALLLTAPLVISLPFFGLPFLFLVLSLAFVPFFLIDRKLSLNDAMRESFSSMNGIKMQLFLSLVFASVLLNAPMNFLNLMVAGNFLSTALITAFFQALRALVMGRLYALFYLYYYRSYPGRRQKRMTVPHDPMPFFREVNRRGGGEETSDDEDDDFFNSPFF